MAERKYYWIKLKKDFFKRHDIRIVESMPNGKDYILFYLKLLLESVDHDGHLRFSETIPYNEQMLSVITNTNIDTVRAAMSVFQKLDMVEILDDETIYMNEVKNITGSETSVAERVRRHRQKKEKALPCNNVKQICNTEKEKEKELEKELDIELEKEKEKEQKINYQLIADMYNDVCTSFPKVKALSDNRKKAIKARLRIYSLDDFKELFEKAEASSFLKGKNDRDWSASFDWLIADKNMAKVLEGKYDDKGAAKKPVQSNYAHLTQNQISHSTQTEGEFF